MRKLDFVIVGTFKSATSSIAFDLQGHSQISLCSPKDPYYFLADYCHTLKSPVGFLEDHHNACVYGDAEFEASFPKPCGEDIISGEATPLYLYRHENCIENIKTNNPDMKIVIILRNPVERAYSNIMHNLKDQYETKDLMELIGNFEESETEELHPFFHYVKAGFYSDQVKAFMENFKNTKVITYDDYVNNHHATLEELYSFLGVPYEAPQEGIVQLNKTGVPRNRLLHKFILEENLLKRILRPIYRLIFRDARKRKTIAETVKNRNIEKPELPREFVLALNKIYEPDLQKLSDFLDTDFRKIWGMK